MSALKSDQSKVYQRVKCQKVALPGFLRRVEWGAKDYTTGEIASQHQALEVAVIEQKISGSGPLKEVHSGPRRFLLALSGQTFAADKTWQLGQKASSLLRPKRTDRLWLVREARELLITSEPTIADSGLGVLFEVVAQ